MSKKSIIILSVLFLLIVGTLGLVIFLRGQSGPVTPLENTSGEEIIEERTLDTSGAENTEPGSATVEEVVPQEVTEAPKGAVKLTETEVVGPIIFYQGNSISYFSRQGSFFQAPLSTEGGVVSLGDAEDLGVEPRAGLSKIYWPTSGNAFLAEVTDAAGQKKFTYFSGDQNKYFDLPDSIISVDWLGGSKKIAYAWRDKNGNITLNSSAPDGSGFVSIAKLNYQDIAIKASPSGQNFLFYRTANPSGNNRIFLVSGDGKLFKSVIVDGYNYGINWAPDNHHFLFSKRNNTGDYVLWLGDIAGDEPKNLGVVAYVDKAAWAKDSSFVVVSGNALSGDTKSSKEMFYKINIKSLTKEEFDPGISVDPRELFLNLKEDIVFFKNNIGGALYYLPLNKETPDPLPEPQTGTATEDLPTIKSPKN